MKNRITYREGFKIFTLTKEYLEILKTNKLNVQEHGQNRLIIKQSEHGITKDKIAPKAIEIINKLNNAGFRAYIVGGAVRDLILNKIPKDFDIVTDATPEQIVRVVNNSRIIGRRFKIVHAIRGKEIFEITTFRSSPSSSSRNNDTVTKNSTGILIRDNNYSRSMSKDVSRRDFTINALYLDISCMKIYDFYGGVYDIINKNVEIIGDPQVRYEEDPVRMIRAVRFAAKLNFGIEANTKKHINSMGKNLCYVSPDRMYEEIVKLLLLGAGLDTYKLLDKFKLLPYIFGNEYFEIMNTSREKIFIQRGLLESDKRTREGKSNSPYFLYAILLFPVFKAKLFELYTKNTNKIHNLYNIDHTELLFFKEISQQIIASVALVNIPQAISMRIVSSWINYIQVICLKDEVKLNEMIFKNTFRATFDLINIRSSIDPHLVKIVSFLSPYYKKAQYIQQNKIKEKDNTKSIKANLKREKKLRKKLKREQKRSLKF